MSSPVLAITAQVRADLLLHPGGELGAAGAAGEQRDPHGRLLPVIAVGEAGEPDPGVRLVAALTEISSGVSCSTIRAISSGPALTARSPGISSISRATRALSALRSPQTRTSSSSSASASREGRRADGVQGGDHGDPVGDHLLGLLGGAALPDAERAGRLAAHRRGQRHRAVDQDLPRSQRLAQVVEVLRLGAEGDGEEDDLVARRGVLVEQPLDLGTRHRRAQLRSAASSARSAEREPIAIGAPARAQRSARPAPSAPVPPTIGMVGRSAEVRGSRSAPARRTRDGRLVAPRSQRASLCCPTHEAGGTQGPGHRRAPAGSAPRSRRGSPPRAPRSGSATSTSKAPSASPARSSGTRSSST